MEYLTWRQLRDQLNTITDEGLLTEPVLLALQDAYGAMQACPAQLLDNTAYQLLVGSPVEEEPQYELLVNSESADLAEAGWRALRHLPPGALLLHYSEMEEDAAQQDEFLRSPNPHSHSAP